MLRNDLINLLSEKDNDPVAVSINGFIVDVDSLACLRGHIVLLLEPEEMNDTLEQLAAGGLSRS